MHDDECTTMMHDDDERRPGELLRAAGDDDVGKLIRSAGPRPQPPAEDYASVLAASRAAWRAKVRSRRLRLRAYAVAASVALIGGAAALYQLLPQLPVQVATAALLRGDAAVYSGDTGDWRPIDAAGAAVYAGDAIRTSAGGRAAFTLANGASLRLDVGTELHLTDTVSMRLTTGAVYLDTGESAEPVRIETRFGTVHDIGTRFEVRSLADALRLRVRAGAVEVRRPQRAGTLRGDAGEELRIAADGPVQRRPFPAADEEWTWTQAVAAPPKLENPTVFGYLRWIGTETGRELRFDSPATEARAHAERWLGDAEGLTPTEVLDVIAATSDFSYRLTADGGLFISRNPSR